MKESLTNVLLYVVVSHARGNNAGFQNIKQTTRYRMSGVARVKFFEELAAADGLEYCSIDKSSGQARGEVVNWM